MASTSDEAVPEVESFTCHKCASAKEAAAFSSTQRKKAKKGHAATCSICTQVKAPERPICTQAKAPESAAPPPIGAAAPTAPAAVAAAAPAAAAPRRDAPRSAGGGARPVSKPGRELGRRLTALLRHGRPRDPQLRDDGFVRLAHVRAMPGFDALSYELARDIVEADNKERFALRREPTTAAGGGGAGDAGDGCEWWIRANQGHTLRGLDPDKLLTRVSDPAALPVVLHGTYRVAWPLIKKGGLSRMKRNHVHFAPGLPGAGGVISGMRASAELLVYVDAAKAIAVGVEFFVSEHFFASYSPMASYSPSGQGAQSLRNVISTGRVLRLGERCHPHGGAWPHGLRPAELLRARRRREDR
jgi:2'-phosphotransferase